MTTPRHGDLFVAPGQESLPDSVNIYQVIDLTLLGIGKGLTYYQVFPEIECTISLTNVRLENKLREHFGTLWPHIGNIYDMYQQSIEELLKEKRNEETIPF